jgi:hypothetical protein
VTGLLTHVAAGVETTGLDATGEVAVVGFALELGYRVCYQTDGRDTDSDAVEMTAQRGGHPTTRAVERSCSAVL